MPAGASGDETGAVHETVQQVASEGVCYRVSAASSSSEHTMTTVASKSNASSKERSGWASAAQPAAHVLARPARKADRDASATLSRLRQAVGVEATTPNKLGWSLAQTGHAGPPHAPFEGDLTLHNPPS